MERINGQRKDITKRHAEKELECLSLQSHIKDLQQEDSGRAAMEVQLCAAISYSRQENEM